MTDIHQARTVRILIASPSDVAAERVIHRLKLSCKDDLHLDLQPKRWETDVPALMEKPAQDIVNEWLVDESACAVCIFWTRIGTPTDNAEGGAVEKLVGGAWRLPARTDGAARRGDRNRPDLPRAA